MKDRGFKLVAVAAMLFAAVSLTVAFASYTETLKISGTVTAKSSSESWRVKFANLSTPTLGGYAEVETAPTLSDTQVAGFNVNFYAPGDSVSYTFDVKNTGLLDAKLTTATIGTLSCAPAAGSTATTQEATDLCADLSYELVYTDGGVPSLNDSLPRTTGSKTIRITVTWDSNSTVRISDDVTVTVGQSTFIYTQA